MNYRTTMTMLFKRVVAALIDVSIFGIMLMFLVILVVDPVLVKATNLGETRIQYEKKGVDYNVYKYDDNNVLIEVTPENSSYTEEEIQAFLKAFNEDEEVMQLSSEISKAMFIEIGSGALISGAIFYVLLPLLLKRGRTLGKLAFGLALIDRDGKPLSRNFVIIRQVTFIIVEIFLGLMTSGLVPLISLALVFFTKKRLSFHDIITSSGVTNNNVLEAKVVSDEDDEYYKRIAEEDAREHARDLTIGGKK